ncbi:MAG: dTMP kinase [bacterium]
MAKGFLISFEGIDGSGKTTQAKLLYNHLQSEGYKVIYSREPGGTELGEKLANLLKYDIKFPLDPRAEFLLFAASRAQLTSEVIEPYLLQGHIVIMDRYIDASEAYQGWGRQLDVKTIRIINHFATSGIEPDLTFLLNIPLEEGLARAKGRIANRDDRFEREEPQFYSRVRNGYLKIAEEYGQRVRVIDVMEKGIEEIFDIVKDATYKLLRGG